MRLKGFLSVIMAGMLLGVFLRAETYPRFQKDQCPFEVPLGLEVQCGYVSVPEKRSQWNSPKIRLQVAVVKPYDPSPTPDPVVVLNGGPGLYTLDGINYWMYVFSRTLSHRELILFDPRGTGYSQPSLNCPEVEKQVQQDWSQNLYLQTTRQDYAQALRACHDRLVSAGVDLSAYTTAANAADVRDIRRALGYSKWNLYGGDYGTRLALAVMQEDAGGVRSVILDSAYPPQVDLYGTRAGNLEKSLQLVFQRCSADKPCNLSYPDLQDKFQNLVNALNHQAAVYRTYSPATDQFHDLILNGDRWIWAVSQMFYGDSLISELPKRISTINGDMTFSFGADLNQLISMDSMQSEGTYYSIQCSEAVTSDSLTPSTPINIDLPTRLQSVLGTSQMGANCAAWGVPHKTSFSREAVSSDIPTLILAGELDPITPPAWGQLAAKTLRRSQFLEFPGFGHGVLGEGRDSGNCTFQIVSDFIDHPEATVDSSCIHLLDMGFLTP